MTDAPGLGWVPFTLIGAQKGLFATHNISSVLRPVLRRLLNGPSLCRSCFIEANRMDVMQGVFLHIDVFCGDLPSKKKHCVDQVTEIRNQVAIVGGQDRRARVSLPDCLNQGSGWKELYYKSPVAFAGLSLMQWIWDPSRQLRFWMGIGGDLNGAQCDAVTAQPVDTMATCTAANITSESLSTVVREEYEVKCPALRSARYYADSLGCLDLNKTDASLYTNKKNKKNKKKRVIDTPKNDDSAYRVHPGCSSDITRCWCVYHIEV
jgi:hypothetical protein